MWTTTTRLHLLNAITRYGLKKTSFIAAYLKVYAKTTSNNWKNEYNKMVKEYFKNKTGETVKEYFKKKRAQEIELLIEKKKEEKLKIIERMIYGYDNIETDEESDNKSEIDLTEIVSTNITRYNPNSTLSNTLIHLSTLNNLPPHLELPGPKPETLPPIDVHPYAVEAAPVQSKEEELDELLEFLERSGYGTSVSSVDQAAFERFFKSVQEKSLLLEKRAEEVEEILQAQNALEKEIQKKERLDLSEKLKEYYQLDFHEYPKKKSSRDKSKWIKEFKFVADRLRTLHGGQITCDEHKIRQSPENRSRNKPKEDPQKANVSVSLSTSDQEENVSGVSENRKVSCAKCFDVDALEYGLEEECRPNIADYIFRSMLFLQTVIFTQHDSVHAKEAETIKTELYKFYEYYRK
ncbi:hypothetical protein NEIRO03_2132 [Nematocida sp. AWRm78]|nr:hypothetical protein NEIRO02_2097 [Nematocida sp. AWRm79]KAI5185846.1 hypothetical protein NEIRO03_2132 [Nematocida sp. AWRm78]